MIEQREAVEARARPYRRKHVVVCVDDDPAVLRALHRALQQAPYEFITTEMPDMAIELMEHNNVSVLIADELMPGMPGHELVRIVGERFPRVACIMLTGYPELYAADARLHGHIRRVLLKPWTDEELKETIDELLHELDEVEGREESRPPASETAPRRDDAPHAEPGSTPPRPRPQRPKVLFVDDDEGVLAAFRRILRHEPYEVLTTTRVSEALEWIDSLSIQLVVVDQRMPEMDGLHLLKRIGERSPATLRVMLTGFPEPSLFMACTHLGVDRLLLKPWHESYLKQTLRRLLHRAERRAEPESPSAPTNLNTGSGDMP